MKWEICTIYGHADTGKTDELGNAIKSDVQLWTGNARFTPWTDAQIQLTGRTVTDNEQQYAVPIDYATIKDAVKASLGGLDHKITKIIEMAPRWCSIQVRVMKNGK